jgi:dipeptidyl-peptidase-3
VTTAKTPPAGKDILTASATNFYGHDVALTDLKGFVEKNAINSKVVKQGGKLVEQVYRCGTPDGKVPAGLYAKELSQAVAALTQAKAYAEPAQAAVLEALIKYYQTGDLADQHDFNVKWVQNDAKVDFVNGFIETYRDARAAKGAAEALVSVRDLSLNELMQKLAANALYFEKKAPWLDKYRKLDVKPPTGKAVEVLVETGDFSVSIIGDNLPNEEDIHQQYGTKNFLMTNASAVFAQSRDALVVREFDPDDTAQSDKVGIFTDNMLTAMHEIIGHGSGLVLDKREPRETLRENYSALEEARADLMAYWNVTDAAKLKELGVEDADAVAREMYESLARSLFGVLNHYPKGEQAEEDHDRDRLLIWNWVAKKGGVGLTEKGGKHYAKVLDLKKARAAVGELLAELMRIKSEGDGAAIEKLIQTYGLKFDGKLRDEVVARYKALNLPPYRAGIYGTVELVKGADGKATDAKVVYTRDFLGQQLDWARSTQTLGF